jgi:hypothetical protein
VTLHLHPGRVAGEAGAAHQIDDQHRLLVIAAATGSSERERERER